MSNPRRRRGKVASLRPTKDDRVPVPDQDVEDLRAWYESPYGQTLMKARHVLDLSDPDVNDAYVILCIHARTPGKPLDALRVVSAAARLGLPPPSWAAAVLDQVVQGRVEGRVRLLDHAFGFSAPAKGGHRKAQVYQELLEERDAMLSFDVYRLHILGFTIDRAADRVARKLRRAKGWNRTIYALEPDQGRECSGPAEREHRLLKTIRALYYKWRSKNPLLVKDHRLRAKIRENKNKILASFPAD